jgi:Family of unknown function (DUF5670)
VTIAKLLLRSKTQRQLRLARQPLTNRELHLGLPREPMLWTIFAILIVLWLLGWGFRVGGSMIHLLLVIALIVAVINLVSGRKNA